MIIERYLYLEILRPFVVGLGLLVIVFTGYSASVQLSQVENGMIMPATALSLILLNTLVSLEVLLPTALFFSILTTITRLYKDSEMAALRAAGVSELHIVKTVGKFSLVVAAIVAAVSLFGRPWAYQETYRLESQGVSEFDLLETETGQFIDMAGSGYILFAKDADKEQGLLKGVFLKSAQNGQTQLIQARSARLPSVELGSKPQAEFYDGYMYILDGKGNRDVTSRFNTLILHLPVREAESRYRRKAESSQSLRKSTEPKDVAEFQARVSSPMATIILAMLAVPLGRTSSRQTRFGSFFIAVVVYALSLSFVGVVRNWLENGDIPSNPGMWLAYIVPALLLVFLLNTHSLQRLARR